MNIRLIDLDKDMLYFRFLKDNSDYKEIDLRVGYNFLTDKFFREDYPTEIETEYAINYIEDELMKDKALINNNEKLVFSNKQFITILRKNGYEKNTHSRRDIEDLFSKYASLVLGEPLSRSNIDLKRDDFAILLLLREIMHHLKFEEITLVNSK